MKYNDKNKSGKRTDDQECIRVAKERATEGATYWKDTWEAAEDDLNFLAGDQWPSGVRNERELEQRPCLTNNVLPTFVDQVIGDQRQNKPAIKVSTQKAVKVPKDDGKMDSLKIPNESGTKEYELNEVMAGIVRSVEKASDAETAYDMAFQAMVESSISYLRVRTDYVADDSFEQDIVIEAIENQFSVTIDPSAKKLDKSDAGWLLIDDQMTKEEFERRYPGKTSSPIGDSVKGLDQEWFADNTVRISEYFTREPVIRNLLLLSDGREVWRDEVEPVLDELAEMDVNVVRERKVKTFCVYWRKITGHDVLEGPIKIANTTIPVVPVFGKKLTIKKKEIYRSVIRFAKDAQRMSNYWDSAATEAVALAPKAPFKGTPEQVEGFEHQWETANTTNRSILYYNQIGPGDTGPDRQQPASVPAAEITQGMNATQKIKETLGLFNASIGAEGPETSGRAIIARQRQGDRGSFAFVDNWIKAIERVGGLVIELVPTTYDTERVARICGVDGSDDYVKLNEQIFDEETKEWVTINDLSVAKYDLTITTGPAYATQRMEAAESMIQFAQAVPSAAAVMADLIASNMDWPGSEVISERLKKITPANVLTNEEREKVMEDQPEPPPPTPEQQVQMAEFEARGLEAQASMAKAAATEETAAATAEKAQTELIKAQLEAAEAQAQLGLIEQQAGAGNLAYQEVRELVAQAIAELVSQQQQQAVPQPQ